MKKFLKRIFNFIFLLLGIAFLLGIFSKYVSPTLIWPLAFAGLGFPIIVLSIFLYFIFWLFKKDKKLIQPLILLALLFFLAPEFYNILPSDSVPLDNATSLKVMSYNVRNFEVYNRKEKEEKRDEIFKLIKQQQPDILCLQEAFISNYDFSKLNFLREQIDMPYVHFEKGTSAKSGQFGVAVFSNYPIKKTTRYAFGSGGNVGTKTDIDVDNKLISVFNVHLESINIENKYYNYSDEELSNLSRKKLWQRSKRVIQQLKDAFKARSSQAQLIRNEIDKTNNQVIVCGDFNDSPTSFAYQTIKGKLYDTFRSGSFGIGNTYPEIPFIRIDYIFTSLELNVLSFKILKKKISDHYPVIVELQIPKEKETKQADL